MAQDEQKPQEKKVGQTALGIPLLVVLALVVMLVIGIVVYSLV